MCKVIGCNEYPALDYCPGHKQAIFGGKPGVSRGHPQNPKTAKPKTEYDKARASCDKAFSRYGRLFYSDRNGYVRCWTSPGLKVMFWTEKNRSCHLGHFEGREHMNTRWNIKNAGPQCRRQNTYKEGNKYTFGQAIDKFWGKGTADEMKVQAQIKRTYTVSEIRALTKYFNDEAKKLLKQKGLCRNGKSH